MHCFFGPKRKPVAHNAMMLPVTYSTAKVATFFSLNPPISVRVPMKDNRYPQPALMQKPMILWVYVRFGQL